MSAFITLEGGEGAGKTRQCKALVAAFEAVNLACVLTREPGGSPGAEQIRALVVEGKANRWNPVTETLLFYAARSDHVEKTIKPGLWQGKWVICDRFLDSTLVYQGGGKGIGQEWIRSLHSLVLGKLLPDLTLVLDIDPEVGLKRTKSRENKETRFEEMELDFHTKVRDGFLAIARGEPGRCAVIDAAREPAQVHAALLDAVNMRLGLSLRPREGV